MSSSSIAQPNLLRFDLDAAGITKECERLISHSRSVSDRVAALSSSERTFKNVVLPLAIDESEFRTLENNVTFPSYVNTNKEIRDASAEAQKKVEAYEIESSLREDVYKALREVKEKEWGSLNQDEQRILARMLRDFERMGLNLPQEKRDKVKALKEKLSEIQITFQKNLSEDKTELLFTEQELDGLPTDFVENLKKDEATGKRVVSLKYPELFPVLRYAKNAETRRQMEYANSAKCIKENTPLFEQALKIRQELAELLGYKTHADYVLDIRMAKNTEKVRSFLTSLREKCQTGARRELDRLQALKDAEIKERGEQHADTKLAAWDFNYYHTLLKEKEYDVNENLIKDYFPLDHVMTSLLAFVQETFRMRFEEVKDAQVWHEEVRLFNVFDADSGDFVGQFYMDVHPREGKYGHAAAFPLQCHYERPDGTLQKATSAMVCNFTKPTASKPSLLKHDEVVTLFHEFGHLMHGFASKAKYGRFSGTSVERDFVEAPSQFMENFVWEATGLKRFSKHYQTGEPLPDELINKMVAAKNVNVGLLTLRQLFFGIFDLTAHTSPVDDVAKLYNKLREEVSLIPAQQGTNGAASFGHLMGGYDVGYYGYMFSEVYSCDIFSEFKKNGLFAPEIGKAYRKRVLEVGGMQDGFDILQNFLGRAPSDEAFLEQRGLK